MPHPQDGLCRLFDRHHRFLDQATVLVAKDASAPKTASYHELLLLLTGRLITHKAWLLNIEKHQRGKEGRRPSDPAPPVWGPIVVTCVADDGDSCIQLQIIGPADGDTYIAATKSEQAAAAAEADIKQYSGMTEALARATDQVVLACGLSATQPLDQSAAVSDTAAADAAHIALLKKYNDTRDIAQQLMGIIADNRGVPVRSLYTDASFGVGVDD